MISLLNDNIKASEIELFKLILNKFILDDKYKSPKIKKAFLYLAKVIISNKKIKDLIYNESFLNFLSNNINESNNIIEIITNQSNRIFNLNLIQRFSIEILLVYLLKSDKDEPFLKTFTEKLISTLNTECNSNYLFHYNNLIFKQIYRFSSMNKVIFDKNNYKELVEIFNFVNIQNNSNLIMLHNTDKNASLILFSLIFPKYHLIMLYKIFIKIYLEKRFSQTLFIINMIKDLIQNQTALYSGSAQGAKNANANKTDSLTKSEETKDDLVKNLPLLSIRDLDKTLHVKVKKFLIKSLTHCLKITLFNISKVSGQSGNPSISGLQPVQSNTQKYLEFLNHFMSISMVLILSEECWDIKVNGVNLLLEIIKRFSKIKDDRVDDNSLLIQQYEAQISSCIKMIFGNNFSIESLFKGLDLLYCYICIPITTDYSYVKRIDSFMDIDLHKNNPGTIFSEQYDHFYIIKKLKFFAKLYMTSLKNKKLASHQSSSLSMENNSNMNISNIKSISVFASKVSDLEIYGDSLETTKNLTEYFDTNLAKLFKNIYDMLNDFHIILNSDPKYAKNYKSYEFLASGNRIAYSFTKVHKYSQIYLKILSFILLDKRFKAENFFDNFPNIKKKNLSFDNICEIIIYHISHFSIKNSQNSELNITSIADFHIYSDTDITFELKEKLTLNAIKSAEMLEILFQILLSDVSISKKCILNILNLCFFLINFSIKEFNDKILCIVEILLKKLADYSISYPYAADAATAAASSDNATNTEKVITEFDLSLNEEEKRFLGDALIKFCFNFYDKSEKSDAKHFFSDKNNSQLSKLIEILFFNANLILPDLAGAEFKSVENTNEENENANKEADENSLNMLNLRQLSSNSPNKEKKLLNDLLIICKILFGIFRNTANQEICKLTAAKLFALLSSLKNLKLLKLFYDMIYENINSLHQFDKYFILFYMIIQNISKKYLTNQALESERTSLACNKDESNNEANKKVIELDCERGVNSELIDFTNLVLMNNFKESLNSRSFISSEKSQAEKDKILFVLKSLNLACNSNFDAIFKALFENILFYAIEENIFFNLLSFDEFQSLILAFTLTIENDEKRKNLILILLFLINEKAINNPNELLRLSLISLKLISKDLELIASVAPLLDRNYLTQINNLAIMQRNQMQEQNAQNNQPATTSAKQEQKIAEKQTMAISEQENNKNIQSLNKNYSQSNSSPNDNGREIIQDETTNTNKSGPKLKALKFGKK